MMKSKWILDSGCSRHMTGEHKLLSTLKSKDDGIVTFGDNGKGKIVRIGNIGNPEDPSIENVLLVDGLKHNLISISQLCDKGYKVIFDKKVCTIIDVVTKKVLFIGSRKNNVYRIKIQYEPKTSINSCLIASNDEKWLWHRRLGHASMNQLSKLSKGDFVKDLPKLDFKKNKLCDAYQFGKRFKLSFKSKDIVSTSKPLELIHIDLFGPSRTLSLGGKRYVFVLIDDFPRYTWVIFLINKSDVFNEFQTFCKRVQNEKGFKIIKIRSDHGGEFENDVFENFCIENDFEHNFSFPRTPQQNGVVERKNRTLQEIARIMLCENNLPKHFWAEAVNTACYILNRVLLRPILNKTPYELWFGNIPRISYFKVFGCKCFILNIKANM